MELDASANVDSNETEALSKQVSDLIATQVEKDATVATLTSQAVDLNNQREAASVRIADLKTKQTEKDAAISTLTSQVADLEKNSATAAEKDATIANLKASVTSAQEESAQNQAAAEAAKAAETAAENKITKLRDKLEKAAADTSSSADTLTKMEDLEDEVDDLKARVSISEANALKHYDKMRRLRGAHRAVRASLKGNVLNAEEVNTAMEAELEALQMQREIDLNEVNIVLEKLTPLVEGK